MKKHYIILSAAAALAASSPMLHAQTAASKPVGVRTETLKLGFNLIASNLLNAVDYAGSVSSLSADGLTVTLATAPGSSIDTAVNKYVLFVVDGANSGANAQVSSVSGSNVVLAASDSLTGLVAAGGKIEIRKLPTISDYFGANNSAGLVGATTASSADIIWIPDVNTGLLTKYYYNTTSNVWRVAGAFTGNSGNVVIYPTDGLYVQRVSGPATINLTFTGHVKSIGTKLPLSSGFNVLSNVVPVTTTLLSSGISASITSGANGNIADVVWVPDATAAGFTKYFYNGTIWRIVGEFVSTDRGATTLPSAFIIQRRGSATNLNLSIPSSLDI
jgi:hypothetical protein